MTAELLPDLEPCGCRRGEGHSCRPSFVAPEEWPSYAQEWRTGNRITAIDQVGLQTKRHPESGNSLSASPIPERAGNG